MTLKRLDKLLNKSAESSLDKLVHRAQEMDDLTACLQGSLAGMQRDEIVAANLREDGDLVVICRSSSWAARLRFESEKLLFAAQAQGYAAKRLRVRVSA